MLRLLPRLVAPLPCETCSGVAFCGRACREAGQAYHRHECRHLGLLLGSGMSVLCHLALRAVTQRGLAFFRALAGLGLLDGPRQARAGLGDSAATLADEQRRYLKVECATCRAGRG